MGCNASHSKVINADEVNPKKLNKKKSSKSVVASKDENQSNEANKNVINDDKPKIHEPNNIEKPKDDEGAKTTNNEKPPSDKNEKENDNENEFIIENGSEEEEIPSLTLDSEYEGKDGSNNSTISEISESYSSDSDSDDHGNVISKAFGYKYVRKLGQGAFSTVLEMKKGNNSFAIKICDMSKEKFKFFKYSQSNVKNNNNGKKQRKPEFDPKEEVAIMKRFSHPYVIKFYDFYEDNESQKIYIVMELLSGGNISKCPTLQQKKLAFAQSVSALQYIHFQRIAHRDIKVDNILRAADGSIRITDFGISELVPEGTSKIAIEMKGTPAYSPPEMFGDQMYDPFAADVWSLGVTLYFVLFDKLPFIADKLPEIQRKVTVESVKFPPGSDSKASDLIQKMLNKNPEKRIKLNEIWQHPWMEGLRDKVVKPNFVNSNNESQIYKSLTPTMRRGSISQISSKNGKPSLNCL